MGADSPHTAPAVPGWARISIDLEIAGATLLKLAGHIQAEGDSNLPNPVMRADARQKVVAACEALAALERLAARKGIVAFPRKAGA